MTARVSLLALLLLAACRPQASPPAHRAVEPPITSPDAIPDAPVSGTLRGAPFTVRDARYVVDRRMGYAHTDIKLSAAKSEAPCGPLEPARAPSVWLRLEGADKIETKDIRLTFDTAGPWSVHYQVFEGEAWQGVSDASALVSLREPSPDGRLVGGLSVCFSDDAKSCVSGSFDAQNCPPVIDQAVRGALPPETIPPGYLERMRDGGKE